MWVNVCITSNRDIMIYTCTEEKVSMSFNFYNFKTLFQGTDIQYREYHECLSKFYAHNPLYEISLYVDKGHFNPVIDVFSDSTYTRTFYHDAGFCAVDMDAFIYNDIPIYNKILENQNALVKWQQIQSNVVDKIGL